MSMFHELMMRKKEQIMYATIKGSLTESPEGVFSGFSSSNYLKLQQQFQPADKNWEIVIKTEITQLNVVQTIIGSSTNSNNIQLSIRDTNTLRLYRTTNGTSDAVISSSLTIDSLGVCYFKISFNGSQYKVSVSQDGNNYINYIKATSSTPIYNNSPRLALGLNGRQTSTEYFRGSIDLNNSYIKIGATKYNLQAVVGYTKVGSPTITDGVVSGFSSSAYIQTSTNIGSFNSLEEVLSITTGASVTSEQWLIVNGGFTSAIYTNGKIVVYHIGGYSFSTTILQPNTNYVIKFVYKNGILSFYINDILQFSKELSVSVLSNNVRFGSNANASFFQGNINLNETYIKKDGKLWFNGQQA